MTETIKAVYQNSIPVDKTGIILNFGEAMAISMAKCIEYGTPFEEALIRGEELSPEAVKEAQSVAIKMIHDSMSSLATEDQSKEEILELAISSLEIFNNCTLPSINPTEYVNEITHLIARVS